MEESGTRKVDMPMEDDDEIESRRTVAFEDLDNEEEDKQQVDFLMMHALYSTDYLLYITDSNLGVIANARKKTTLRWMIQECAEWHTPPT